MSHWTYVTGIIKVRSPGRFDEETVYMLKSITKKLPIIHGSEGDVAINIVPDLSSKDYELEDERGLSRREAEPMFWYQHSKFFSKYTFYLITLSGTLRDRDFDETLMETEKLIFRLAKRVPIEEISVTVRDDFFGKSYTFNDTQPLSVVYEYI